MNLRLSVLLIPALVRGAVAMAQPVSLPQAYEAATRLHPLAAQPGLIRDLGELQDENLSTRWKPQFSLDGQAVYLSDVVEFPLSLPGFEGPDIPHFQYQATLNVQQVLYDGGATRAARNLQWQDRNVQSASAEVEVARVKMAVMQAFFTVQLLERQLDIFASTDSLLRVRRAVMAGAVESGAALPSTVLQFDRQLEELGQQRAQAVQDLNAARDVFAEWTGFAPDAKLVWTAPQPLAGGFDQRPEYALFEAQQAKLSAAELSLKAQHLPVVAGFAKGGGGQPNPLNFFEDSFSPFYQIGVRVSWSPWDWGRTRREKEAIAIQKQLIDSQREALDQQLTADQLRDEARTAATDELLAADERIISLQQKIIAQAAAQLEQGVITPAEYLAEIKALTTARLTLELHLIQRQQSVAAQLTRTGQW